MKKFLIVLLAAFTAYQASGQETFGVVYTSGGEVGEFERGLLEVLDIEYMKADFTGDLENRRMHVTEVLCNDGEFSTRMVTPDYPPFFDTRSLQMFIKPVSQDSVTVTLLFSNIHSQKRNLVLRNKYFTVVKTGVKELMKDTPTAVYNTLYYPFGVDIPIMAYSAGIEQKKEMFGEIILGFDICGLRDAMVHPREWYEKFGIKNYVYYTVRFE